MKTKQLLALLLAGMMIFAAGCTKAPADSEVEETTEIDTVFEGKITSIDVDNQMMTIDLTSPYKDIITLGFDDETEFSKDKSKMLRMGAMIRFETNGTMTASVPAMMSAIKITDSWIDFDGPEKIEGMLEGHEDFVLNDDNRDMEIQKDNTFLIELKRKDALDTQWYYEVSDEGAFEYIDQAQFMEDGLVSSLYQFKAIKKGEQILYFHEYNPETNETLSDIDFQLIVRDETNTEGNITELVGNVLSIENETVILESGPITHSIYTPDLNEIYGDIKIGDKLVVGAEIGEASYKMAFVKSAEQRKTESGLPIIQHVVKIEKITADQIVVIWNEALLSIYHNDIANNQALIGSYAYIEYAVDKTNEANELLHLELIK